MGSDNLVIADKKQTKHTTEKVTWIMISLTVTNSIRFALVKSQLSLKMFYIQHRLGKAAGIKQHAKY